MTTHTRQVRLPAAVHRCATPWAVLMIAGASAHAIDPSLPFFEEFEPDGGGWNYHQEWLACEVLGDASCPNDPSLPMCSPPANCSARWGPLKFESWPDAANGGQVYSGLRSGRQPIWDPYWGAILHPFDPPLAVGDLRLKVQQFDFADLLCDCDQAAQPFGYVCDCDNLPPPLPNRPNFDVHGWIVLTNPLRTEYYVLAVNTKKSWTHLVWGTKTDGWNVSAVERVQGWRKLEIVVHPYTGAVGDVEFLVNDAVIAQGRRQAGSGGGIDVEWLRLGGDPALITESILTNTFEEFWYDEVALTFTPAPCNSPPMDADGDGDVDQEDFGVVQACVTGDGDPDGAFVPGNCHCFDVDDDFDVDQPDLDAFAQCASGPTVPADPTCGGLFP